MSKLPLYETPESSIVPDEIAQALSDRTIVSYRCKVYRALLDINSDSRHNSRPLILQSGRGLAKLARR
jgi:hypothetical protein